MVYIPYFQNRYTSNLFKSNTFLLARENKSRDRPWEKPRKPMTFLNRLHIEYRDESCASQIIFTKTKKMTKAMTINLYSQVNTNLSDKSMDMTTYMNHLNFKVGLIQINILSSGFWRVIWSWSIRNLWEVYEYFKMVTYLPEALACDHLPESSKKVNDLDLSL